MSFFLSQSFSLPASIIPPSSLNAPTQSTPKHHLFFGLLLLFHPLSLLSSDSSLFFPSLLTSACQTSTALQSFYSHSSFCHSFNSFSFSPSLMTSFISCSSSVPSLCFYPPFFPFHAFFHNSIFLKFLSATPFLPVYPLSFKPFPFFFITFHLSLLASPFPLIPSSLSSPAYLLSSVSSGSFFRPLSFLPSSSTITHFSRLSFTSPTNPSVVLLLCLSLPCSLSLSPSLSPLSQSSLARCAVRTYRPSLSSLSLNLFISLSLSSGPPVSAMTAHTSGVLPDLRPSTRHRLSCPNVNMDMCVGDIRD